MKSTINIKKKQEGGKTTLFIEGSLETNTSPILTDCLDKEMPNAEELVLDFEKVDYISSAGLRALLYAQKTMSARGGMTVTHVNEDVMEIFEVTNFTDVITIV